MTEPNNESAGAAAKSKGDKFRELMGQRMTKIVERIDGIKRLFNPKDYEFSEEQVNKVADQFLAWSEEIRTKGLGALAPKSPAAREEKPAFKI